MNRVQTGALPMRASSQTILRAVPVALGLVALVAAGSVAYRRLVPFVAAPEARGGGPGALVVLGPAKVRIEHDDRSRPCEHVFRVFNPMSRPITILEVTASCTCTVVAPIKGVLGPGQERPLKLQVNRFDPFETTFSTTATVETDGAPLEVKLAGTVPPSEKVLYRPLVLYLKPEELARPGEHLVTLRLLRTCALRPDKRSIRVIGGPATIGRVTEREDGPHYTELSVAVTLPALEPGGTPWDRIEIDAGCEAVAIPIVVLGAGPGA